MATLACLCMNSSLADALAVDDRLDSHDPYYITL